jgi:excisionase family DNA binding protein
MKTGGRKRSNANTPTLRALRSVSWAERGSRENEWEAKILELEARYLAAGGPSTIDYLRQNLTVKEAAAFLGTTTGELYKLLSKRAVPFLLWGKRGKRFNRILLIAWQDTLMHQAGA